MSPYQLQIGVGVIIVVLQTSHYSQDSIFLWQWHALSATFKEVACLHWETVRMRDSA